MSQNNFYNQYWQERGLSKGLRLRYQIFMDWVEPESSVLDLGGGDGHLGEILTKEKHCQVAVLDLSSVAVNLAQKRGLTATVANLEEKLPFPDNNYEVVILSEVLEHIINSENLIKEATRVSKKMIIGSVPNTGFYKYRWQLLFGHFPRQWFISPTEHLRYWTVNDFKKMITDLNLNLKTIKASAGRRWLRDFWPSLLAEQICFKIIKN